MMNSGWRLATVSMLALISGTACGRGSSGGAGSAPAPAAGPTAAQSSATQTDDQKRLAALILARADSSRPHSEADVHFVSGMIPHHSQAIRMARLTPTRSSNPQVKVLSERIIVAQRDEINLMQSWLRARKLPVPDSNATHLRMKMDGMEHDMLMPGMLSEDEMAQLEKARGTAFDRLMLTYMIRHHQGAIEMVEKLFASPGAAQDDAIYKLASDVFADQTSEIDRMERLLAALPPGSP
jgi:uncharacterized protein (DUF305 family)